MVAQSGVIYIPHFHSHHVSKHVILRISCLQEMQSALTIKCGVATILNPRLIHQHTILAKNILPVFLPNTQTDCIKYGLSLQQRCICTIHGKEMHRISCCPSRYFVIPILIQARNRVIPESKSGIKIEHHWFTTKITVLSLLQQRL